MKTYKEILNEWARQTDCLHEMSDDEMKTLRSALLEMYKKIVSVCQAHGLTVMLGGGTCLGAIRHKGFIPWDDDLDLNMMRPDYNKFIELCKNGALGNEYEYAFPDGKNACSAAFLKIYKKNTTMINFGTSENSEYPKGIFIDIFPIEGVPSNTVYRRLKGFIADGIRFVGNCVSEIEYKSESMDRAIEECPELKNMIHFRRIIGRIFSFMSYKKWAYLYDRIVANEDIKHLVGAPSGRCLYNGEVHNVNVFLPTKKVMFEGMEVEVPGNVEAYLTRLYGRNYMQVPPIEKRERHFVVEFKL